MSTADGQRFSDALNGDYYELFLVVEEDDGSGGTITTRTKVGFTVAGVTLSNDSEDWSVNPSSEGVLQNFVGKGDLSLEFTGFFSAGGDALDALGFVEENGDLRTSVRHPMVEVWVYPEPPDGGGGTVDPGEIIECPAFIVGYDDIDMQENDSGEVNFNAFINNRPRLPLRAGEEVPTL